MVSAARTRRAETEATSYASTPGVRSRMQVQRTRDTAPELAVRRLLHAQGLRYRVDRPPVKGLRRRADIVFGPAKVAIYIDGCFWHGCPEHGRPQTKANAAYWSDKMARNKLRDADTDARLADAGWLVIRTWEHDSPEDVALAVANAVLARRASRVAS
jgi:DNA mismatch endonuclease, patch repair protein